MKKKHITKTCCCLFLLISVVSCSYSKSRVHLDKDSGGYNDVTIVISPELKASDCPRILEDIKVRLLPCFHGLLFTTYQMPLGLIRL